MHSILLVIYKHTYKTKQLQKAGDSELLSRFTEENVIVLESRASGKTLRFRAGEVEGTGGHGALGEDPVTVLARLLIIMGCSLCRCVQVRACSGLYLSYNYNCVWNFMCSYSTIAMATVAQTIRLH